MASQARARASRGRIAEGAGITEEKRKVEWVKALQGLAMELVARNQLQELVVRMAIVHKTRRSCMG
jgi:hypothetical protein